VSRPLATKSEGTTIEEALIRGDLAGLDPEQRVTYYLRVCESLKLNPYTKPFDYLSLNNKLVLYANKSCTDQLRDIHKINITGLERERIGELLVVTASARSADGRTDSSIGAVAVEGLKGESLANAMMRAETKSKRRVTLSLCGLGMLDESEVDSVPGAYRVNVDTGEVKELHEPIKEQAPAEDRDLVRAADDRLWRRWLEVRAAAESVGLQPQAIKLGVERQTLIDYASQVQADIEQRTREAEAAAAGKR
jgi:hypothetical protein